MQFRFTTLYPLSARLIYSGYFNIFSQFKYTPTISFHLQSFVATSIYLWFYLRCFLVGLGPFTLFPYRIFAYSLSFSRPVHSLKVQLCFLWPCEALHDLLILLVYATFSLAWALDKGDAMRQLFFLFSGVLLLFFVTYYFHSLHDLNKLFWIWLGAFAALIILGC